MHAPSPSSSQTPATWVSGLGGMFNNQRLLIIALLTLSTLSSCRNKEGDKGATKTVVPTPLKEGVYDIPNDGERSEEAVLAGVANAGIEPDVDTQEKNDMLGNILEQHISHGQQWAGEDFYQVIFNARNNKKSYKNMRSVMKRIMERVATSETLQVGFDPDIDQGEVFSYQDITGLTGLLKISTTIDEGVQYVKIIFSPEGVEGAYNVGNVGYEFSGNINICCSRPVDTKNREWQYFLGINQGSDLTSKQLKDLVEELLRGNIVRK